MNDDQAILPEAPDVKTPSEQETGPASQADYVVATSPTTTRIQGSSGAGKPVISGPVVSAASLKMSTSKRCLLDGKLLREIYGGINSGKRSIASKRGKR